MRSLDAMDAPTSSAPGASPDAALNFVVGEGELAHRIRAHPWEQTELGPPAAWPEYGALRVPGGKLTIAWKVESDATNLLKRNESRLVLTWTEQGVPALPLKPARRGFGSELIEEALPYRLAAETSLEFRGGGVRCTISMPLPDPGASAANA